jgi:transmembrane sensor
MSAARLTYLLTLYSAQRCTAAELQELAEMILAAENDTLLSNHLQHTWNNTIGELDLSVEKSNQLFADITGQKAAAPLKTAPVSGKIGWLRAIAALVLIVVIAGAGYFIWRIKTQSATQAITKTYHQKGIQAPVNSRATITLGDGQKILLDSFNTGVIVLQGNVQVRKAADGQIAYSGQSSEIIYNTLANPRGSKVIHLTLADGTIVWLNCESSIRYPVAFSGNSRQVDIKGEAYFEVAKNSSQPFMVTADSVVTEVLGTHFNLNSYRDAGSTKITLLEGTVRVKKAVLTQVLRPGEQADVQHNIQLIKAIDTAEVMAWKEGKFSFGNKTDITAIMQQMARWYDLEISYEGKVSGYVGGGISRAVPAEMVLSMLTKTGIAKFRIEGRKVIVTAK